MISLELKANELRRENLQQFNRRGWLILPFTSLMRFTCDYNVKALFVGESRSMNAIVPIKKGDEVIDF